MSGQYWNTFGYCPTCKAKPGKPCLDLRVLHRQPTRHPHRDREQLVVPLLPEEVDAS